MVISRQMGVFDRLLGESQNPAVLRTPFVLTDIHTLTPPKFSVLGSQLDLSDTVLHSFLALLEIRQIPSEQLDTTLREMANQYGNFRDHADEIKSYNTAVNPIISEEMDAIERAAWQEAESLFNEAAGEIIRTAQSKPVNEQNELLNEAASVKAAIGELKESRLEHREAVQYYRDAVELLPAGTGPPLARYSVLRGRGLIRCGALSGAEGPLMRALKIREREPEPDPEGVAECLFYLGLLYNEQGRHTEAEPFYARCLAVKEQQLGPEHPDLATLLKNLALLYHAEERYGEAEPLYARCLAIEENLLGPEHPVVASTLNDLALFYGDQKRYAEAEPLYARSLAITEKVLGPEHPDVASTLNNLALLYHSQERYAEAKPLYARSLAITEKVLGPEHPDVASTLNNLGLLYHAQGHYRQAEPLHRRSLEIKEKAYGPAHPDVAIALGSLAAVLDADGRGQEAQALKARL